MLNAALLFAGAMVLAGGSMAWTIISKRGEGGRAGDWQSMAVCCSVLFVLLAVVNVFVNVLRLRLFYRCPKCRARLPRAPAEKAGAKIVYRCTRCGVDWDTGWTELPRGSSD
jgi:DNA-directed RNA polymerase subunit RPC12/RpoP